jgi:protein subunit release factor A
MENNSILQKLDGLEARFEEVSTLITDPEVIADQNRFVKLTKEYKDLGDIMDARKRYIACLNSIREALSLFTQFLSPIDSTHSPFLPESFHALSLFREIGTFAIPNGNKCGSYQ